MIKNLVIIFVMHFVAGYFLQSRKISTLKREKTRYLFIHVGLYTLFFIVFSPLILPLTFLQGLVFSLFNGILHLVIDYYTGRYKNLYFEKDKFNFNLTVGVDYALHLSILMISYICLTNCIIAF
jgi:hypothetical protein